MASKHTRRLALRVAALLVILPAASSAQQAAPAAADVTFTKDIAPILQRSCQQCHRPGGVAPMPLITYEQVRPWARAIKTRTGIGPRAGVMPPWFVERDLGIQKFKNDISPSDEEIVKIAKWADDGAPQGDSAHLPKPLDFDNTDKWTIGEPDLVLRGPEVTVPAIGPDRWTKLPNIPSGLTEDRYVAAVEVREVNDVPRADSSHTVGGRYVFHHLNYSSAVPGVDATATAGASAPSTTWPVHEVGRNADLFAPEAGRLMAANSVLQLDSAHLHSNGRETKSHLEFAFKFFPKGYTPQYRRSSVSTMGNGMDLDVKPNTANQELHSYVTLQEHTKILTFEPHLHAPGVRMCLQAVWGHYVQTLNCVGYDHNWVKQYVYSDDAAPLLPKGTILHLIAFLDTTSANPNLADGRNWAGGGRRSVANMFINLGYSVALSEEQFQAEMAKRRANMKTRNDYDIGCPLCWAPPSTAGQTSTTGANQQ
jgi:hypothetical protein